MPRIISWNTTFKCNLSCAHCYMDAQERESKNELTTEEGKMFIDQIAEVSKPILVLGGGSPSSGRTSSSSPSTPPTRD